MADDFKIQIGAELAPDVGKSTQQQLNKIKNLSVTIEDATVSRAAIDSIKQQLEKQGVKLNITLPNSSALEKEAENIGNKVGSKLKDSLNKIIQKGSFEKNFLLSELHGNTKGVEQYFKTLSNTVSIQEHLGDAQNLQSFTVNLKNADGVVEQLRYHLNEAGTAFSYIGGTVNDSGVIRQFNSISTKADELQIKLDKLRANFSDLNAPKAIKDDSHISALNEKYNNAAKSISKLRETDQATFSSMQSNVKAELSALESLISQFRNAEYAATSLRTKDIKTIKIDEGNELEAFVAKMQKSGHYTEDLQNKVGVLKNELSGVFDANSLNGYLNKLSNLKTEFKAVDAVANSLARDDKIQTALDTEHYARELTQVMGQLSRFGSLSGSVFSQAKVASDELKASYERLKNSSGTERIEIEKEYQLNLKKTKNLLAQLKSDKSNEIISAGDNRRLNFITQLNNYLAKNTAMTKANKQEVLNWIATLESVDDMTKGSFDRLQAQFKTLDSTLRQTNQLGLSLKDKLTNAWEKFGGWSIATGTFMRLFQELKNGIHFVGELDSALTNINYTMDVNSEQLSKIGKASIDTGKELRTSAENVLSAVTTYANATETADSILNKSKPTIMLSNVTGMDTASTTDILQGAIHQFDLDDTEESLYRVSDILQAVSKSMAVDFSKGIREMAEGIQVSGSVAKDAGYDLERYSSILGNLIEKTRQSGSELGRSIRTMLVRTTKASSSALAGGEVTEEDLSNAEAALDRVGIKVRDTKDTFRDFDEIMTDLYNKIDDLSEVDLSNIAYEVASTRQTAVFKVMVKTWGDYLNLSEKAYAASGETIANQEKYAESLDGHLGALKSTSESIWSNLIDSNDLNKGIDILENLLQVIDKLTEVSGGKGLIGAIGVGSGVTAFVKNLD